jgi:hypothetical protein
MEKPGKASDVLSTRPRRMLSPHEIALLLRLSCGPVELMGATPDLFALREVGLVELVGRQCVLTSEGDAVLRLLGRC